MVDVFHTKWIWIQYQFYPLTDPNCLDIVQNLSWRIDVRLWLGGRWFKSRGSPLQISTPESLLHVYPERLIPGVCNPDTNHNTITSLEVSTNIQFNSTKSIPYYVYPGTWSLSPAIRHDGLVTAAHVTPRSDLPEFPPADHHALPRLLHPQRDLVRQVRSVSIG